MRVATALLAALLLAVIVAWALTRRASGGTAAGSEHTALAHLPPPFFRPWERSQLTLLIPSYPPHIGYLQRFLRSMMRHCTDCFTLPIHVLVDGPDYAAFAEGVLHADEFLPLRRLDVRVHQEVNPYYAGKYDPSTHKCTGDMDAGEGNCKMPATKYLHQTMKKVRTHATRECTLTDSAVLALSH